MPNHIKNRLEIVGTPEQVQAVIDKYTTHHKAEIRKAYDGKLICHKGDDFGWLDTKTGMFSQRNKPDVLGLPDGWEIELTTPIDEFPDFNKILPQPDNIFKGNLSSEDEARCAREGRPTWYRWNIDNWGTKWGSYSWERESFNVFTWETAWAGTPKLILLMSEQCPDVKFIYEYADEDTGSNCGRGEFVNGFSKFDEFDSQSPEAYELAFKLRPEYAEHYELVDGTYQYKEEDE